MKGLQAWRAQQTIDPALRLHPAKYSGWPARARKNLMNSTNKIRFFSLSKFPAKLLARKHHRHRRQVDNA
jgi:hypothetical protein